MVDDCSTDGSYELAKELAKGDKRIKVYKLEKNSGEATARDYAVQKSTAEIIAVADSDDFPYPNRLETIANFFEKNPNVQAFYTNLDLYYPDEGGKIVPRFFQPYNKELLYQINYIPNPSSAYRKKAYEEVGGYDKSIWIGNDYELWLKFSDKNMEFGFDPRSTVKMTQHAGSMRHGIFDRQKQCLKDLKAKHNAQNPDIEVVKILANEETYKFFSQPKKLDLWFDIKDKNS
jgi:glycosyltransferase involved in cell wall biosynthesis